MSSSPLMVSVSGIRGIVGGSLHPEAIVRYTAAYATWLRRRGAAAGTPVVVGRDGRPSGRMVLDLVKGVLSAAGLEAVDLGVSTTPGTAMAVGAQRAAGGIVITASHNPAPWNALKFLDDAGDFLAPALGQEVLAVEASGDFHWEGHAGLGGFRRWTDANRHHVDAILALPAVEPAAIAARGFRAVVDAVNASGSEAMPLLLDALGVGCSKLYCDGSGDFPHNPEPTPAHLADLAAAVRAEKADLGLAVDPDSDRLVLVDENGRVLSEELTLALAVDYYLGTRPGPVAANLSTSRRIDDVAARHRQVCHRSPVGEAHVVAAMRAAGAVIGGEGNGGVILPELHAGRDGLVGTALVLAAMASTGRPLSALADALPDYRMEKRRLDLAARVDSARLVELATRHFDGAALDTRDGVKASYGEGWIHVRASNTEAILRLIGESEDGAWLKRRLDDAEVFFSGVLAGGD